VKSPSTSVSIPLPAKVVSRFESSSARLELPTSTLLGSAINDVARWITDGWGPKALPPGGEIYIFLRLTPTRKLELDQLAKAAGIKFVDLGRIAAWAALCKMEASDQILWPIKFTKDQLDNAVSAAVAELSDEG
jgi:hypothetical protein